MNKFFTMPFIQVPILDGETSVIKMINTDIYDYLAAVPGEDQCSIANTGETLIIAESFVVMKRVNRFKSVPGWILVTVDDVEMFVNVSKFKEILPEGEGTKFIYTASGDFIADEPYADVMQMIAPYKVYDSFPVGLEPEPPEE